MASVNRNWHVYVENTRDPGKGDSVFYKFMVTSALEPDEFEIAMQLELVKAIRAIKKEMIMKGMEP